jgi:hypothetical protein
MGKAIIYVSISGAAALIGGLWFMLGRGWPAGSAAAACALGAAVAAPILARKDFQFVGIPGSVDLLFSLGALVLTALGGARHTADANAAALLLWAAVLLETVPAIRISLVTLRAFQRPVRLKLSVGALLAAIFGINIVLGVQNSTWVAETSVDLVKKWFPEATAAPPPPPPVPGSGGPPPPPPGVTDPTGPVAIVAGRPITSEMVEYQRFIDKVVAPEMASSRQAAVAALLQAYTARAVLERKFKAFDASILKDESQWLMVRKTDAAQLHRIRTHKPDLMFLDVYVGANGLYVGLLRRIFDERMARDLRDRAQQVLKEIRAIDGEERPGPKLEGTKKSMTKYSGKKREFINSFELEAEEDKKPDPKDPLAARLALLKVNHALPEIVPSDKGALIVRRYIDDFHKRANYETWLLTQNTDFGPWLKLQSADFVIEIPDPELRQEMLRLATDVNHIIKTK